MDRLPSLRCRVRSAHTATQTPRKKMANAIILPLPTRRDKQDENESTMENGSEKIRSRVIVKLINFCVTLQVIKIIESKIVKCLN